MSKLKEGLALKTDEERLDWWNSLTQPEREEVQKDAIEMANRIVEAFAPLAEMFSDYVQRLAKSLEEISNAYQATKKT